HVGPITLKPRFQPTATGATILPLPGELPFHTDARQSALICASWTVGSLHRLSAAGCRWLTYFETAGPRGVMEADGSRVYPVYHVLADAGPLAGADVVSVALANPAQHEAIAIRAGNRMK